MHLKKLIFALITLGVIFSLTWFVSDLMNGKMVDYAFFVGLIVTIVIRLFTSSGGFGSNSVNLSTQSQTGMKVTGVESPFLVTQKSFSFIVALSFTIISLLTTAIYYWKEF